MLRDIARGVADVPDMMAAIGGAVNPVDWAARGVDAVAGTNLHKYTDPTPRNPDGTPREAFTLNKAVDAGGDYVGAGRSEQGERGERIIGAGIRGVAGALVPIPGMQLTKGARAIDAISGASAGVAGKTVEELSPDSPAYAKVAAALAAGIAPQVALSTLKNATGGIRAATKLDPTGGKELAAKRMQEVAGNSDEAIAAISRNMTNRPGVNPLTGELAENPNLAALQREVTDTDILEAQRVNAQNRGATADTVMGKGDVADVQQVARKGIRQGRTELETREQAVAGHRATLEADREADLASLTMGRETDLQNVQAAGETALTQAKRALGGVVDEETSGKKLRELFEPAYQSAKDAVKAMYNAIPDVRIQFEPHEAKALFDRISGVAEKYIATRPSAKIPGGLKDILFGTADHPQGLLHLLGADDLSTSRLTAIDQDLADLAGQARMAGKAREASFLDNMRRQIGDETDFHVPDDYKQQLGAAKAARRDLAESFETGVIGEKLGTDRYGGYNVSDLQLPGKLLVTGPAAGQASKQLQKILPAGATEDFVRQEMARRVEAGVPLTDAFMRNNRQLLARNPKLKAELEAVIAQQKANVTNIKAHGEQTAAQVLEHGKETKKLLGQHDVAAKSFIDDQKKSIADFAASPLGATASKETTDAHNALVGILTGKDAAPEMTRLAQQLRNSPEGKAGVQRAIGDFIRKAGSKTEGFDATAKSIPGNRSTINAIETVLTKAGDFLDDAQKQVLGNIQKELKRAEFAETGGKLTKEGYKEHSIPGPSSTARLIRFLMGKFSNHEQVQAMIKEAMLDPKKAQDLLGRASPDRLARWGRTIRRTTAASVKASKQFTDEPDGLTGSVTDTGEYN
jgi:hypothetical protein